ncbi:MAG: hypothetical protein ABI429_07915, partial [Jatrophihabitantaceae bacterium]
MQGALEHGAVPSTQPMSALTNVVDVGVNLAGTGPPLGPTGADGVDVGDAPPPVVVAVAVVEPGVDELAGRLDFEVGSDEPAWLLGPLELQAEARLRTSRPAATAVVVLRFEITFSSGVVFGTLPR